MSAKRKYYYPHHPKCRDFSYHKPIHLSPLSDFSLYPLFVLPVPGFFNTFHPIFVTNLLSIVDMPNIPSDYTLSTYVTIPLLC